MGSVKLFPNLEAALKGVFNRVLTTLNLAANDIGVEGAKAIAEALKVTAVLTTLNLGYNSIGVEGAKAIAEAGTQRCRVSDTSSRMRRWLTTRVRASCVATSPDHPPPAYMPEHHSVGGAAAFVRRLLCQLPRSGFRFFELR